LHIIRDKTHGIDDWHSRARRSRIVKKIAPSFATLHVPVVPFRWMYRVANVSSEKSIAQTVATDRSLISCEDFAKNRSENAQRSIK
jgi:hypothetical protein